ncbi:hypothetical protein GCM10010495_73860 [Kitasatospora herbaricolor]|nr:hypothetical protein GCM10010495_73860 [Kitasatospora herbaricolor]
MAAAAAVREMGVFMVLVSLAVLLVPRRWRQGGWEAEYPGYGRERRGARGAAGCAAVR